MIGITAEEAASRRSNIRALKEQKRREKANRRKFDLRDRERAEKWVQGHLAPELRDLVEKARHDYVMGWSKKPQSYTYDSGDVYNKHTFPKLIERFIRKECVPFGSIIQIKFYAMNAVEVRFKYMLHI